MVSFSFIVACSITVATFSKLSHDNHQVKINYLCPVLIVKVNTLQTISKGPVYVMKPVTCRIPPRNCDRLLELIICYGSGQEL